MLVRVVPVGAFRLVPGEHVHGILVLTDHHIVSPMDVSAAGAGCGALRHELQQYIILGCLWRDVSAVEVQIGRVIAMEALGVLILGGTAYRSARCRTIGPRRARIALGVRSRAYGQAVDEIYLKAITVSSAFLARPAHAQRRPRDAPRGLRITRSAKPVVGA